MTTTTAAITVVVDNEAPCFLTYRDAYAQALAAQSSATQNVQLLRSGKTWGVLVNGLRQDVSTERFTAAQEPVVDLLSDEQISANIAAATTDSENSAETSETPEPVAQEPEVEPIDSSIEQVAAEAAAEIVAELEVELDKQPWTFASANLYTQRLRDRGHKVSAVYCGSGDDTVITLKVNGAKLTTIPIEDLRWLERGLKGQKGCPVAPALPMAHERTVSRTQAEVYADSKLAYGVRAPRSRLSIQHQNQLAAIAGICAPAARAVIVDVLRQSLNTRDGE